MQNKINLYDLLRTKEIIAILDGDTEWGQIASSATGESIRVAMPYLSGRDICAVANKFGCPMIYEKDGEKFSRWEYFDDLLEYCINQKKVSLLLSYLFSKESFIEKLNRYPVDEIETAYHQICGTALQNINQLLYFGNHELVSEGSNWIIREIGEKISVSAPNIKTVSHSYIRDISNRALDDIERGNYDSAITKSRTMLEEVFCYVIEDKGVAPSESGDVKKLYTQVKDLYNMHPEQGMDKRIKELLSGLEKILTAISEMRNKNSDSHGVGSKRIMISDYHTRLMVNSAMTMSEFILSVKENSK